MMSTTLGRVMYTRKELLALKRSRHGARHPIPAELRKPYSGRRTGAKLKARSWRRYKPCLRSVLMGNVNFLPNKCEEIEALVRNQ